MPHAIEDLKQEVMERIAELESYYKKAENLFNERYEDASGEEVEFLYRFWLEFGSIGDCLDQFKKFLEQKI